MVTLQTADKTDALKRLRLFNQKAQEITGYSFLSKAFHKDAGVRLHFDCEKQTIEAKRVGADREAWAAMCLVLRFFLQPRDRIELSGIAELYQELPVRDEYKGMVSRSLDRFNSLLDRPIEYAVDNTPITHGKIREVFLYGDLAHANKDRTIIFEMWKETGLILLFEHYFEYVVGETIRFIMWLAAMNVEAIMVLEQASPAS